MFPAVRPDPAAVLGRAAAVGHVLVVTIRSNLDRSPFPERRNR